MNERIKELAEQAGFSFKYKTAPDELNPGHTIQDLEKFAELIVREVFSKIEDERFEVYQPVKEAVMKHFGVKE